MYKQQEQEQQKHQQHNMIWSPGTCSGPDWRGLGCFGRGRCHVVTPEAPKKRKCLQKFKLCVIYATRTLLCNGLLAEGSGGKRSFLIPLSAFCLIWHACLKVQVHAKKSKQSITEDVRSQAKVVQQRVEHQQQTLHTANWVVVTQKWSAVTQLYKIVKLRFKRK